MRSTIKGLVLALVIIFGLYIPAHAGNFSQGVQQSFDWQQSWGGIDFSGSNNDAGISCDNLQPKADIKNVVSTYGTQHNDLSSIKTYQLSFGGDNKKDYVIDGNGYFPQYFDAQKAPKQMCTDADGCFVSIYKSGEDTQLTGDNNNNNSTKHNTRTVFNDMVLQWNFMTADDFQTWSTGRSYQLRNTNPVFVALRNNTNCYNDEISNNNNQCVKYYQYDGDCNTGTFVDLYNHVDASSGEFDTEYTHKSFDRSSTVHARGQVMGSGFGHELKSGDTLDIQFQKFTRTYNDGTPPQTGFAHYHISNYSGNDYFIPANTDAEFCSFLNSHQTGVVVTPEAPDHGPECPSEPPAPPSPPTPPAPPPHTCGTCASANCPSGQQAQVQVDSYGCPSEICVPVAPPCPPPPEVLQFTPWTGELTCPAHVTTATTIAAQRFCQSSTGAYRTCQDCIDAKVPGWEQGCSVTQECKGNTCDFDFHAFTRDLPGYNEAYAPMLPYDGIPTTLSECVSNQGMWPTLRRLDLINGRSEVDQIGCDSAFQQVCSHGHFCFAADTMITMADGSTRAIKDIKAGDMVMGFTKAKEALKPYKVKAQAVTPNQPLLNLNGELQLTPNHKVVTSKGRKLQASLLKVGDTLLRGDGTIMTVKSIETVSGKTTVYNLKLEDAGAGFVADGLRVISYH